MSDTFDEVQINYGNVGANLLHGSLTEEMLKSFASQAAAACGKTVKSVKVENHGDRVAISINCGKVGE